MWLLLYKFFDSINWKNKNISTVNITLFFSGQNQFFISMCTHIVLFFREHQQHFFSLQCSTQRQARLAARVAVASGCMVALWTPAAWLAITTILIWLFKKQKKIENLQNFSNTLRDLQCCFWCTNNVNSSNSNTINQRPNMLYHYSFIYLFVENNNKINHTRSWTFMTPSTAAMSFDRWAHVSGADCIKISTIRRTIGKVVPTIIFFKFLEKKQYFKSMLWLIFNIQIKLTITITRLATGST